MQPGNIPEPSSSPKSTPGSAVRIAPSGPSYPRSSSRSWPRAAGSATSRSTACAPVTTTSWPRSLIPPATCNARPRSECVSRPVGQPRCREHSKSLRLDKKESCTNPGHYNGDRGNVTIMEERNHVEESEHLDREHREVF